MAGPIPGAGSGLASRWRRSSWDRLVILAAVPGAVLLAVVVATAWPTPGDERAYWDAGARLWTGQPLYDPAAPAWTPYAYWYPPVLAQVLAPFTAIAPADGFTIAWTILLSACLWELSGRDPLRALALVAFLPVALELRVRNVHLVIAMLTVLALRRSWVWWIPATAIKLAPVLGVLWLLAAGRRREAALVTIGGLGVVAISVALAPDAWRAFLELAGARATTDAGGLLAIPYPIRLAGGAALALAAGRRGGRYAEAGLVVAITVANPTLFANAFSLLVAIVALWRVPPGERRDVRCQSGPRAAGAGPNRAAVTAK